MKRLIALALVLTMAISMVPVTAGAENEGTAVSNDVTLEGTSSFGNLLTNTVNESQQEGSGEAYGARICDLVIEGTTATVEYTTPVEANLVVAIYDQDSGKMLGSGTVTVSPEETIAQVEIEIPVMPYYFSAGAYLLDAATNDPVSEEFKTDRYTKVMQDILAATVEDFNPELVLNLDNDDTTNFAVFNENTLRAEEGGESNQVTDNGNGTYTIKNADAQFLAMQPGDTFTYTYPDGTVLIVNAASVSVKGNTVTVTENPDADLSTVFDFVKIEEDSFGKDYTFDDSELNPGAVISEEAYAEMMGESPDGAVDIGDKVSIERTYDLAKLKWGSENNNLSVKGAVKLGLTFSLKVYVSFKYQYVSFSSDFSLSGSIALEGKLGATPSLGKFDIYICTGVYAHVNPQFVVEASGKLSYQIECKGSLGQAYDSDLGGWQDIGSPPSVKSKAEFKGTLFIGLKVKLGVAVISEKAVDLSVTGKLGFEVSATEKIQSLSSPSSSEIHTCALCFEGEIHVKLSADGELKVLNKPVKNKLTVADLKWKLSDFYVSVSEKDSGFTRCPHKAFKTTITVRSDSQGPVKDVPIKLYRDGVELTEVMVLDADWGPAIDRIPATDENGVTTVFLPDGRYSYQISYDGKEYKKDFTIQGTTKTLAVVVDGATQQNQLTLPDSSISLLTSESYQLTASFDGKDVTSSCVWSSSNAKVVTVSLDGVLTSVAQGMATITARYKDAGTTYTAFCTVSVTQAGDIVASGTCGENLTWTLDSNGLLTISGNGPMVDYQGDGCEPWSSYFNDIKKIIIRDGVTHIGSYSFCGYNSLRSVVIQDSVSSIGDSAFWNNHLLSELILPDGLTSIENYAFACCWSLDGVTIPKSVNTIEGNPFAFCSNLVNLYVDNTNPVFTSLDGVLVNTITSTLVLFPAGKGGSYYIPSDVRRIGDYAFAGCSELTSITTTDFVTSIGQHAFDGCNSLTSVGLSEGIGSIDEYCFSSCYSLSSIIIPDGVTRIKEAAFSFCGTLSSVTIPCSTTIIERSAFVWCDNLSNVYYNGTIEQWNAVSIGSSNEPLKAATIHCTDGDIKPRPLPEEAADALIPETEAATEATEETLPEIIEETEAVPEIIEEPEVIPETDEEPLLLEEVSDRLWYSAPAGAEMTVEPVLQKLSAFTGTESGKNGVRSVKFTGLEPGEEYVLIVSLIPGSLVPQNLLYIDQDNAKADGTLSFTYIPRQDVSARVQLYGVPAGRTVTLDREYLTMEVGSADQKLTAAVTPEEWAGDLTWSAENPENTEVISVNEFGDVTPMAPGTAYAVATVTHGQYVFSARCRVDVTQKRANQEVTGVQLGTTSLTTELLRTDYAAFDVVLLLAQNRNPEVTPDTIAPDGGMEDNGVAIESAAFADEKAAAVFDLAVKDDRTLLVVPKASAINNPKPVAGSYTSKVRVTVDGKAFITDTALKLTVKKSMPKLKVSALTFNPFYTGQSQAIQITGATVTDIESKALPEWLTLENGVLTLTEKAPAKASGKVSVTVKTAEWGDNISTNLTIPVKTAYAAPKLKLSATSVTVAAKNSQGISLKLLCGTKTDTLETLNVEDIQVDGFRVKDFDRTDGSFTLIPSGENFAGPHPGTVSFSDTRQTVPLSLKVTAKAPSIAAKPASVTLNSTAGDSARIPITASPADYRIPEVTLFLTDSRGNKLEQQDWLNFWYENGVVTVETVMDKTQPGATYYLHVSTADTRDAVITVKTLAASKSTITASAKISGGIDLSFPASAAVVKPAFKNYASGGFTVTNWDVTEYAGKTAVGSVRDSFTLGKEDGLLVFRADSKNPPVQGHTYSLTATLTLDNGRSLTLNNLKLPVKRTPVKLKLSKTSLSLNRKIGDTAVVDVTCLTRGYDFTNPVAALIPPNSKDGQSIDLSQPGTQEPLTVSWSDGKLTVTANSTAEAGKTYKIALRATENDPAVTLSVKILDTAVTASMKASGTIDVVRDGTAITVTPSYKNYAGLADIAPQLTIESWSGRRGEDYQNVEGLFGITFNANGTFTITKVPGAEVDTALKYRAKLTFDSCAKPAYVNLAVKSGTAKVAVSGTPVLYKADRFSRGTFRLTTADKALNPIVKAEIKDAKYQGIFEVYSYGSGEFAIGFKGNKVPDGKLPTSVVLNVYVDGNPAKSVASVALKLQVR